MAGQLKLVRREDFGSDQDTLDLLDFGNGIGLANNGYLPAVMDSQDDLFKTVTEVITERISGTSHNNLASVLQALTLRGEQAQQYWQGSADKYGIWLRAQSDGESNARQALVKRISQRTRTDFFSPVVRYGNMIPDFQVGIERVGAWESTSPTEYVWPYAASTNILGYQFPYTTYSGSPGSCPGDLAARIAKIRIENTSSARLHDVWVGFRSSRLGDIAKFQSIWPAYLGTINGDYDYPATADATAISGYRLVTKFAAGNTLQNRFGVYVGNVATYPAEQYGKYLVLLRAKPSTAGSVIRMRLVDGYGTEEITKRSRVVVDKTDWYNYEMGTVSIPNYGRLYGYSPFYTFLQVDAERVSGAASLYFDSFILIPIAEGGVKIVSKLAVDPAGTVMSMEAQQRANGAVSASGDYEMIQYFGAEAQINGGGMPIGAGIAVLAGQRLNKCDLADIGEFSISVYPRWKSLRGNA